MRNRRRQWRTLILLGLVATGGMMFAGSGLACTSFGLDEAQSVIDFCFLFDCQNGAFGGLIDFCDPNNPDSSFLADCANLDTGS